MVDQTRSPCIRGGARHILEPAGKALRGRGHLRERGEQERQRDHGKQRMGGRALRWEVDTLEGRTFGARVVSRPGVPGKGRRGSEGGEKQGLREGQTKGEVETRTYGTGGILIGMTEEKGSRFWNEVGRSIWGNVAVVLRRDINSISDRRVEL